MIIVLKYNACHNFLQFMYYLLCKYNIGSFKHILKSQRKVKSQWPTLGLGKL